MEVITEALCSDPEAPKNEGSEIIKSNKDFFLCKTV